MQGSKIQVEKNTAKKPGTRLTIRKSPDRVLDRSRSPIQRKRFVSIDQ